MPRRAQISTVLLWTALVYGAACGSKPPAPSAHAAPLNAQPVQPQATSAEPDEPPPSHDPFEQPDDAPVDSKSVLKEMRHDCCTELPATEIDKHRQHP